MLALVDNEPRTLSLKQSLRVYLDHRLEVIRRRSVYDLRRARERAHILQGLLTALEQITLVIQIIRESETTDTARSALMSRLSLSALQANAILDMPLRRLAALERTKLEDEFKEKIQQIQYLEGLLASPFAMRKVIADELLEIKKRFNDPRRTAIISGAPREVSAAELLAQNESTWVTLTVGNRISRTYQDAPPKITARTEDVPRFLLRSNTADILYVIAADGRAASVPVQGLPMSDEPAEGTDLGSQTDFRGGEGIAGAISITPSMEDGYLFFATEGGDAKRIRVADLPGLVARAFPVMNVGEDRIIAAHYVEDDDEVMMITAEGQAIRFKVNEVRPTGLPAGGMRGIRLTNGDRVVSAGVVRENAALWTITETGIAKSSPLAEYPLQGRAGAGVTTMKLTLGDRLATSSIATLNDLVIILTLRGRFKVVRFSDAPHGARTLKGDYSGIKLLQHDRVYAVTQIVRRPEVAKPPTDAHLNGAGE